ncbi:succinate dehydrogenase [ubiquinone] cytochrome b small subunit, mitochondrial [Tribolium madens]|uniref:succinate dehydrogenase [ubiquinone] cytochrome b small subunit, mitochondrial n=1 Tax=Tribolium madens TaxID=41895 RepID=UPI001CF74C08|nr:succinate dehydrogenase [ubiquinone] cytochrome b small subunit, mitochondrial [Tribolium madens]
MALALILRNAPRIQVGALQQNLIKSASIVLAPSHKQQSTLSKSRHLLLAPQKVSQVRFMSADHSKLWPMEKALSLSMIALVPAAIAMPNIVFDNLLAVASVIHFHWGLEAVVVDYARPIVVGNILPKLALGLLYLISATTLGGLIYYNINDIGIGKTIRKFWAIKE